MPRGWEFDGHEYTYRYNGIRFLYDEENEELYLTLEGSPILLLAENCASLNDATRVRNIFLGSVKPQIRVNWSEVDAWGWVEFQYGGVTFAYNSSFSQMEVYFTLNEEKVIFYVNTRDMKQAEENIRSIIELFHGD